MMDIISDNLRIYIFYTTITASVTPMPFSGYPAGHVFERRMCEMLREFFGKGWTVARKVWIHIEAYQCNAWCFNSHAQFRIKEYWSSTVPHGTDA